MNTIDIIQCVVLFLLVVDAILVRRKIRLEAKWNTGMFVIMNNMVSSFYEDYRQRMERLGMMTTYPETKKGIN